MWVVYFVQWATKDGPVKIGATSEIKSRLRDLQVASPYKLAVVGTIVADGSKTAHWMERLIHGRLRRLRLHGEWFQDTPLVWEVYEEIKRNGLVAARSALIRERYSIVDHC
jgi:hypothetical protein